MRSMVKSFELSLTDTTTDTAAHTRASSIMSRHITHLGPDMTLDEACDVLLLHRIHAAPVIDDLGVPIGMLTLVDVIRHQHEARCRYKAPAPQQPRRRKASRTSTASLPQVPADGATVADAMMPLVFQLPESISVAHAAALMSFEGVSQLLITGTDGTLRGMVTVEHIGRWLAQQAGYVLPGCPADRYDSMSAVDAPTAASNASATAWKTQATANKTVLVVEDDDGIREGVAHVLRDEGYHVLEARDGRHALEVLHHRQEHPGLILLDLMMPRMNGWEFREVQLNNAELSNVPVVVLTAHSAGDHLGELRSPAAMLHKPVSVDRLLGTVAAHYGTASN